MRLQIALDRLDLDVATRVAAQVADHTDWIEVGTSLIKRYGMLSVREVVAAAGTVPVLADLKTADDAATEFGMAFDAGARGATVLASATEATIDRSTELARQAGAEVVLDLLAVSQQRRDTLLDRLPADVIFAAHLGKDAQNAGGGAEELLGSWTRGRRIAVAGGLAESTLARLVDTHSDLRAIVGSAVTGAADPATSAERLSTMVKGKQTR
ncbi:3-hexulose-6-phosphate synthase [Halopolyspora algeriensis]|uniref:3-hexulose-6-phosphate synthase n=1 Tax=Halopolyspora algeriensis TaxID=1500506 RepID=A0A368VNA7_9ACTN|nr:orotidine 5'-phosphate decarboxylase / HUMPS family protein [Halopolyspora algeriensis]RCW43201.1 3-hexulose-6-phosphate synthase [Halopolyspora algeriensis]TQM56260.1 3-hexulose-6-phosphate synthase [Halopolyspora algeriensis]